MKDTNRTPTTIPPRMISLEFSDSLPGGVHIKATLHGMASERHELIADGLDAVLAARARVRRVTAPFRTPTPMVPASDPAAEFACENPDPEGRVIA